MFIPMSSIFKECLRMKWPEPYRESVGPSSNKALGDVEDDGLLMG
jgi:hypothetical protein